ncbi:universal stress protein [Kordiimonas aquimaris]|uniref:universal stress protein n=1 Tax=Kordiimonas aquimaris TaxID=707591 RepID=UPI0021D0852F|nr:universal stress protein [Kordiimonas aquimaris]
MTTILACIDGSAHMPSVCKLSAWAAKQTGKKAILLHVVPAHADHASHDDLSGQIGLGAKTDLMDTLVQLDAERAKLDQKKGQLMFEQASALFTELHRETPDIVHRRGTLADTVAELETDVELIVIGKRGETATKSGHLGSNLERVTRAVSKPLLIATKSTKPVDQFLIAYDNSANSNKALAYVCKNKLLQGATCHLLTVATETEAAKTALSNAKAKLITAGFDVTATLKNAHSIDDAVSSYIADNNINLLVMGAYGHSAIRRMIFGSTTMAQIERSKTPVLLFR